MHLSMWYVYQTCCMHLHTHKYLFIVIQVFIHLHVHMSLHCDVKSCTHTCLCDMITKHVGCICTRIDAFSLSQVLCICTHSYHDTRLCIVALSNTLHTFIHAHYWDVFHTFAHMHIFALWHYQTSFMHSHMLICPCCTKQAAHYRTHICPCLVTTSNEFHAFAHHHMTVPLVQPQ